MTKLEAFTTALSPEAYAIVRGAHLTFDPFLRLGRKLGPSKAAKLAEEIRKAAGDKDGVFFAYNAETGHEDYVRVNSDTNTYGFICQLKS